MPFKQLLLAAFLLLNLRVLAADTTAADIPITDELPAAGFTVKKIERPGAYVDQYMVFMPSTKFKRKGNVDKWPVLFFLHGKGERGDNISLVQNMGIPHMLKGRPQFPFIVIAPQCKGTTKTWDVESLNALYKEVMEKYPVDTSRIYLTGLSMGGNGTWKWAMSNPEKFTAIAPICGYGKPVNPCGLRNVAIWAFHNADDDTIPVSASRTLVNAVRSCGNEKVIYTESATGGHDAWGYAYYESKLFEWFLEQQ
ncbi:hypothetical protein LX64_04843 [Chitinophaga skermanii]|uniref:Esterase n=1 Tax=Chitinophaga skermanii TaxID=331697 RepID=A0A327Q421_9BACT|nr:alpha/beta hydrolase-fold protein [Chitinophaga skermanii]RAI98481.1 hypothetical protein LX64_04843 [Chitinophaga skermanii]